MFVKRGPGGSIVAVSLEPEGDISEAISLDSAELALFLEDQKAGLRQSLAQSDLQMARVIEDTIQVLIDKGVLRFTDLPDAAQKKLMHRREIRGRFHNAVDLLDDEENIGL